VHAEGLGPAGRDTGPAPDRHQERRCAREQVLVTRTGDLAEVDDVAVGRYWFRVRLSHEQSPNGLTQALLRVWSKMPKVVATAAQITSTVRTSD
jgi:hypothetical protein